MSKYQLANAQEQEGYTGSIETLFDTSASTDSEMELYSEPGSLTFSTDTTDSHSEGEVIYDHHFLDISLDPISPSSQISPISSIEDSPPMGPFDRFMAFFRNLFRSSARSSNAVEMQNISPRSNHLNNLADERQSDREGYRNGNTISNLSDLDLDLDQGKMTRQKNPSASPQGNFSNFGSSCCGGDRKNKPEKKTSWSKSEQKSRGRGCVLDCGSYVSVVLNDGDDEDRGYER